MKCKKYHDDWLVETKYNNPPICRIDANHNVTYDENDPRDRGHDWLDLIGGFIDHVFDQHEKCV